MLFMIPSLKPPFPENLLGARPPKTQADPVGLRAQAQKATQARQQGQLNYAYLLYQGLMQADPHGGWAAELHPIEQQLMALSPPSQQEEKDEKIPPMKKKFRKRVKFFQASLALEKLLSWLRCQVPGGRRAYWGEQVLRVLLSLNAGTDGQKLSAYQILVDQKPRPQRKDCLRLGQIYYRLGEMESSLRVFNQVKQFWPQCPQAGLWLTQTALALSYGEFQALKQPERGQKKASIPDELEPKIDVTQAAAGP